MGSHILIFFYNFPAYGAQPCDDNFLKDSVTRETH
jgi:hypothetical protein